jgi:hypothetical protein
MIRIALISDTHGLLRPEAKAFLQGSDFIVHAGDIGNPGILEELSAIAPVTAVRGNNDRGPWAEQLAETEFMRVGEVFVYVIHDLAELDIDPTAQEFRWSYPATLTSRQLKNETASSTSIPEAPGLAASSFPLRSLSSLWPAAQCRRAQSNCKRNSALVQLDTRLVCRNRSSGSYLRLTAASRSRFARPYAASIRSAPSSSVRKLT